MNNSENRSYFFCGIGGSGMLPLASILLARGETVAGSDRSRDQGRTPEKFASLEKRGVRLFPQDGSGLTRERQILVASAAVEDTVPDVAAARRVGAKRVTRAELLAALFNDARTSIGIAGTSGKSTTTAMIAWILTDAGSDPTVMNGAVMKNFVSPETPFASARVGSGDAFVSEIDESDGSIAMFNPDIAIVSNIAHDHKSMDELRTLFGEFASRSRCVILNNDNNESAALAANLDNEVKTYSVDGAAHLRARNIRPEPFGVSFIAVSDEGEETAPIRLKMPGKHNVSNALAALLAATACGIDIHRGAAALNSFQGVARRFDHIGEAGGVTLIDDFGHNPDKITATLRTLHDFEGRLLVMFQPHGFGPLRLMKDAFIACFAENLLPEDQLWIPQPAYFGGTVDRSVTNEDIVKGVCAAGRTAFALESRDECAQAILATARQGDRIIVMGARDDTLTVFAESLLEQLQQDRS